MTRRKRKNLRSIYNLLLKTHGRQGWWPLNNKYGGKNNLSSLEQFEVCVGAILTQNTAWKNVKLALANLRSQGLLVPEKLFRVPLAKVGELIRPCGYFNQKAKKLQVFTNYFLQAQRNWSTKNTQELRAELLLLWGIGPETCDSILLYAIERPIFVVDSYTRRIFGALGYIQENTAYEVVQSLFMKELCLDVTLFKEYHALIVAHAKVCCKKNDVLNENCVLRRFKGFQV